MREVELSVLPAALTYVVDGRNIISKATIKFATYKHAVSHVLHNSAIPKRKDVQIRLHGWKDRDHVAGWIIRAALHYSSISSYVTSSSKILRLLLGYDVVAARVADILLNPPLRREIKVSDWVLGNCCCCFDLLLTSTKSPRILSDYFPQLLTF